MDWYKSNIKSMEINRPGLLEGLNKKKHLSIDTINKLDKIESAETKDGNKAVIIRYNSEDYRLNSSYRPVEEARKWAEQFKFTNINTVVNMFGFGNGLFARELLKKMDDYDYLLIYEPCYDIFIHVLENYDISDILLDGRVYIVIEDINENELHMISSVITNIRNINSQIQCIYPNYDNIFMESCIMFFKELKSSFTSVKINTNTIIYFGEKDIENQFKNIEFLKESSSISDIKKVMPSGVPAIVVAAGPSVEDNIEDLKRAKGKAVIFAVDRILDYLLDVGVEPDFVVTIDGKKGVEYFTSRKNVTVPLITYYYSNYEILSVHQGRKIFCTNDSFMKNIYTEVGKLPPYVIPSGSVALVAFSACIELGFDRVVLVGQDLAYSNEKSHAGKINEDSSLGRDVLVEGIDGKQIRSRSDWREFVIRYEDLISSDSDVEVIDTKTKGARIKGALLMPLADVIDKYCDMTFVSDEIRQNIEKTFSDDDIKKIKEYFQKNLTILQKIKEKANLAVKDCDIFLKESHFATETKKYKTAMKRITKTNKYIIDKDIYSIMDGYITAKSARELSQIYKFTDDIDENSKNTFDKSKALYKSLIEAVDYIYPKLEEAIDKI